MAMAMTGFVPVVHASRGGRPDEEDTIATADAVAAALRRLGHESEAIALDLDFAPLEALAARRPLAVFNLAEAIRGDGALGPVVPALLEHFGLVFTGAGSQEWQATLSKIAVKERLLAAGLPTPRHWRHDVDRAEGMAIVKSDTEHASFGMDAGSVVPAARAAGEIRAREARFGGRFFAEAFIAGREFNLAILEGEAGPELLPIQEIRFDTLPAGLPHIVDYAAKWDETSAACRGTVRRFGLEREEPELAALLAALAFEAGELFDFGGYARVDVRVDATGAPFILEINLNPCLAPDAGFAAAAAEAGIGHDALVARILEAAPRRARGGRSWRRRVRPADVGAVRRLVEGTGNFSADEVDIAAELVGERLAKGAASGYDFLFLEEDGRLLGYACFGPTPGTENRFDLYWIAVDAGAQGRGLGRALHDRAEAAIRAAGGERIYVDTSSRPDYAPTRAFYEALGYKRVALLEDFYRASDGKAIYLKSL